MERADWRRDLGSFLSLVARPVQRGPTVLNWVLTAGGWAGVAALGWLSAHLLGTLLVLGWVFVVLAVIAGTRLQHRLSDAKRIEFTCKTVTEELDHTIPIWDVTFTRLVPLFVRVQNNGPAADFEARIRDIHGLQGQDPVSAVAWETTFGSTHHLARGGFASLRIANVARKPRAIWLVGASTALAPNGHTAGKQFFDWAGCFDFILEVVDTTHDKTQGFNGRIEVDDNGEVVAFDLEPLTQHPPRLSAHEGQC
jgi:hypothetical protein